MRHSEEEVNELKKGDQVESFGGVASGRNMDKTHVMDKVNEAMRNIAIAAEVGAQRMQDLEEIRRQLEVIEMENSEPINRQTSFGGLFKQQHKRKNYIKGQRR